MNATTIIHIYMNISTYTKLLIYVRGGCHGYHGHYERRVYHAYDAVGGHVALDLLDVI